MKIEGAREGKHTLKEKINRRIPTTDFHLSILYGFSSFIIMQNRVHLFLIKWVMTILVASRAMPSEKR